MPVGPGPEHLVHGNAANPGFTLSAPAQAQIRGALVHGRVFQIGPQQGGLGFTRFPLIRAADDQVGDIRVVNTTRIVQPAGSPVESVGYIALVVIGVHQPSQTNLLAVIHAGNGLRPDFRPRERRQQHGGQDCNDGNDHQQFDQSESPVALAQPARRRRRQLHKHADQIKSTVRATFDLVVLVH